MEILTLRMKVYIVLLSIVLLASCGISPKRDSSENLMEKDSVSPIVGDTLVVNHEDSNMTLIKSSYSNSKISCLLAEEPYYCVIPADNNGRVRLVKVGDGKMLIDKDFPNEYRDVDFVIKGKNKLIFGINWVYQCKIVILSDNLEPISSKIYSYPDGEWTVLDSLTLISDDSYYAEIRTGCNDCGEGIKRYKIKAKLNHKIISSSAEAIGEYRNDSN